MKSFKTSALLGTMLLAFASGAHALKAGDNVIAVGVANVAPDTTLGTLTSSGPGTIPAGYPSAGDPAAAVFNDLTTGATADIKSVNTLAVTLLHMVTDNVGAELTLGVPPKMKLDLNLPALPIALGEPASQPGAASAVYNGPALVAKYLFNKPSDQWRPYVGLGATYVFFSEEAADPANPYASMLGGASAKIKSAFAPVYALGVIYNIDDRWSINASLSYIPLKTTATFKSLLGPTTTGDVKFNTTDTLIRVGYKF